jgi:hypothetical protein
LELQSLHLIGVLCPFAFTLPVADEGEGGGEGDRKGLTSMRIKSSEWEERLQPVSRAEESIAAASFGEILLLLERSTEREGDRKTHFKSSQIFVSTSLISIGGQFHWTPSHEPHARGGGEGTFR